MTDLALIPVEDELLRLWQETNHERYLKLSSLSGGLPSLVVVEINGRRYFCCEDFNSEVDQMEVRTLDRKPGDPLLVWTFINLPEGKVYSYPPCHIVAGSDTLGFGEQPLPGWDTVLEDLDLNPEVISKVRKYLSARPFISYEA